MKATSENSGFRIVGSHLGKFRLINCNLDSFKNLSISKSQISDVIPTSVKWFSDFKFRKIAFDNLKMGTPTSDIMRQLKTATDGQGDVPQSLKFKALEYEFYKNELEYNEIRFWDRIILNLSRTNDFGQNWIKPILIFTALTVLFFILLALSVSNRISLYPFSGPLDINLSISEIEEYIYLLPQLFNPARSLEKIIPQFSIHNPWVYVIDILHKIIYAFFIYQTIKAFRKYTE